VDLGPPPLQRALGGGRAVAVERRGRSYRASEAARSELPTTEKKARLSGE
jgi:hypothetical protein